MQPRVFVVEAEVKNGVDLVNRAGAAPNEIVASINGVAEVISEIAAASAEQSNGVEQVNKALAQMDEVTQQNSALVEENAATAKTLEGQASAMDNCVAFFKLAEAADNDRVRPQSGKMAAKTSGRAHHSAPAMRRSA